MAKMKINNLDDLEKLVMNSKVYLLDKYLIFKQVLQLYPIVFIDIILDDSDAINGIEDKDKNLIPKMLKIIAEIRSNPTAENYSGMSVIRNAAENEPEPEILIDFTN